MWLDTEGVTTKGIYLRAATKEKEVDRSSYRIWNSTIRARQGFRMVDNEDPPQHQRTDHITC